MILTTARLRLEPVDAGHLDGLHAINGDPEVMRFFPSGAITREQQAEAIVGVVDRWGRFGFGWWSFIAADGRIVGFGCIQHIAHDPAAPIEIGWRLRRDCWGQGFATEAGWAMMAFAFDRVGVETLYSVANPENHASTAVMRRLEMRYAGLQTHYGELCATYTKQRRSA